MNAVQHGLTAVAPVIPGVERVEDWEAHRAGVLESLAPADYLETVLAERVALAAWRLRRVTAYEVAETAEVHQAGGDAPSRARLPAADKLEKLQRYESHLTRQFYQALHELEALQVRRRGERTPLARLDLQGLPDTSEGKF